MSAAHAAAETDCDESDETHCSYCILGARELERQDGRGGDDQPGGFPDTNPFSGDILTGLFPSEEFRFSTRAVLLFETSARHIEGHFLTNISPRAPPFA